MTLAQLATAAGLSHGFLSKLERGLASPSIASLGLIARAIGTSQVELLAAAEHAAAAADREPATAPPTDPATDPATDSATDQAAAPTGPTTTGLVGTGITTTGLAATWATASGGPPAAQVQRAGEGTAGAYGLGRAQLLTSGTRRLQPMVCEGDNTDPGDYYDHVEDEFLHVLDGTVDLDLGPHGRVLLGPGDSVYITGGVPHRWCTGGPGRYRMFIVKEGTASG